MSEPALISSAAIDRDNPWPGLASFTEDQRAFFHGRDDEILDLTQLAERRPLVVLFGHSTMMSDGKNRGGKKRKTIGLTFSA